MRRFALGLLLVAPLACSRANPAFGESGDPTPMQGTGGEDEDDDEPKGPSAGSGLVTTDSATASGTGDSLGTGTGLDGSSEGSGTGSSGSTGPSSTCPEDPAWPGYAISAAAVEDKELGEAIEPECSQVLEFVGVVEVEGGGRALLVTLCDACPCTSGGGAVVSIDLGEEGAVPDELSEACRTVWLWPSMPEGGDKECHWGGFAVGGGPQDPPEVVGSNERSVDVLPISFEFTLRDRIPCGETMCTNNDDLDPGEYRLRHSGVSVARGDAPATLGFSGNDYDVINRGSAITEACRELVSWHAVRVPG